MTDISLKYIIMSTIYIKVINMTNIYNNVNNICQGYKISIIYLKYI